MVKIKQIAVQPRPATSIFSRVEYGAQPGTDGKKSNGVFMRDGIGGEGEHVLKVKGRYDD